MKTTAAIDATSRHDGRRSAFFIKLLVLSVAFVALLVFSAIFGSLKVGVVQFLTGLFNCKDDHVNSIIDLRFLCLGRCGLSLLRMSFTGMP